MFKIIKAVNSKGWQGCEETKILLYMDELNCRLLCPVWENSLTESIKLKSCIPYDPAT